MKALQKDCNGLGIFCTIFCIYSSGIIINIAIRSEGRGTNPYIFSYKYFLMLFMIFQILLKIHPGSVPNSPSLYLPRYLFYEYWPVYLGSRSVESGPISQSFTNKTYCLICSLSYDGSVLFPTI